MTAPWHQRLLMTAVGVSLAGHAAVLGAQGLLMWWGVLSPSAGPAKLIYHAEPIRNDSSWSREDAFEPRTRLQELVRSMTITVGSGGAGAGMGAGRDLMAGMSRPELPLDIGEGAARGWQAASAAASGGVWAQAVDLTDIAAAAHGDPILLSYFGAIREQIQRTANAQARAPVSVFMAGTVYVGFVIESTGRLRSTAVVPERSVASSQLRAVAAQIVQSSGPFLPFPPSFTETSKAIIVPIQFAPDSSL